MPHEEMEKMTVSNWSRRPAKLCRFLLTIVPGMSGGAESLAMLAKFVREWMNAHPRVDSDNYQKSALRLNPAGQPVLEVIFYPMVGEKASQLRGEFIVAAMDVARRLNICLLPTEIRTSTAWQAPTGLETEIETETDDETNPFDEFMPSDRLTLRSGYKITTAKKKN